VGLEDLTFGSIFELNFYFQELQLVILTRFRLKLTSIPAEHDPWLLYYPVSWITL